MKVLVHRVETWSGAGPYQDHYTELHKMHQEHTGTRPVPQRDGIHKIRGSEHCGFPDRESLDWWFTGYKRALEREDFNIALYLVACELIRYGKHQVVFERGDLLPVERLPIVRSGKVRQ